METRGPLERAYRRLLLAYPRRYRRERGTEILTTLLDAARPDQRRPSPRDALDLVLGGLRRRLAIPRGPLPAAAATVVALLAALGAAAGTGWRAAAPEPDPGRPARWSRPRSRTSPPGIKSRTTSRCTSRPAPTSTRRRPGWASPTRYRPARSLPR
ncbi:hypothetical protein [Phytohabitans flavus]|uniref:hypothetical protein n=1 Tax=Phytohabitans flavus TaxID=1076124 RepID=UPI0015632E2E|nr:hypothetical protein [Phytohabitans flavus]